MKFWCWTTARGGAVGFYFNPYVPRVDGLLAGFHSLKCLCKVVGGGRRAPEGEASREAVHFSCTRAPRTHVPRSALRGSPYSKPSFRARSSTPSTFS